MKLFKESMDCLAFVVRCLLIKEGTQGVCDPYFHGILGEDEVRGSYLKKG